MTKTDQTLWLILIRSREKECVGVRNKQQHTDEFTAFYQQRVKTLSLFHILQ